MIIIVAWSAIIVGVKMTKIKLSKVSKEEFKFFNGKDKYYLLDGDELLDSAKYYNTLLSPYWKYKKYRDDVHIVNVLIV